MTGIFITFEGGEGAGKSTQAALLVNTLKQSNVPVVATREPGGTGGAEAIRAVLVNSPDDDWSAATEALLVNAARADHVEKFIRPHLEADHWVVCDRFVDSTLAYQGYGKGANINDLLQLHALATGDIWPHLTIILDLPVEHGLMRAFTRPGLTNRFDERDSEFHVRVRTAFRTIAKAHSERCRLIDASGSMEETAHLVWDAVASHFQLASWA